MAKGDFLLAQIAKLYYIDKIKQNEIARRFNMFSIKAAGALAEEGGSLEECVRVFEKARDNTRTLAIALTNCTHPVTGLTMMDTPEGEANIGAGVHGEGGAGNIPFGTSYEMIENVCDMLIEDKP